MQSNTALGARLKSALQYVTHGGRIADIGTDHAYLPIHLVQTGMISRALAADINQGPINSARANIAAAGLSDRIDTLLTDGLHGVESFAPDDILIFGMGGELIARILEEAPWVKNGQIGLILQPMSRASVLREWLLSNGFAITGETLTFEDKYYQTIAARYCGHSVHYSSEELLLGRLNIQAKPPLFDRFVRHEISVLERVIAGKSCSVTADISAETEMKKKLEALL